MMIRWLNVKGAVWLFGLRVDGGKRLIDLLIGKCGIRLAMRMVK